MSNIIIPSEHQSAPKQTELNKAIREAAREISDGTFKPELEENVFGKKETDFFDAGITTVLAKHPLVQDALRTLETQVQDKTSTEYLEKAEQLHEMNVRLASKDRWDGQERWQGHDNLEMRLVNLMQPKTFIERLRRARVVAVLEPHVETDYRAQDNGLIGLCEVEKCDARVWLGRRVVRDCVGVFANVNGQAKYITKLQVPLGPEWTVMGFDEYDVPTAPRYLGWRSAVLTLIRQRVITEKEAEKAFGKVVENEASSFYRQQLTEWRNGAA